VVIGGGVAGLAAATLLADSGVRVTLFEARDVVGGCCATTTLDGFTFHDGAVYLTMINILDHAFGRLNLDRAEVLPLRRIATSSTTTLPDGTVVTVGGADGPKLSVRGRPSNAHQLQNELDRLLAKWRPMLTFVSEELALHPFSYWRLARGGVRHLPKFHGTVASELKRFVSDPAVRGALSGILLYNGLPPQQLPATAILGLIAELSEGLYLPESGMGRAPQALSTALRDRGGHVFLESQVDEIVIRDGRVRGVRVAGQGDVEADAVVSTVSGMQTFHTLIPPDRVPAPIIRKLRRVRLSHQAVSIQFGLANQIDAPAHSVNVLPWMEDQQEIFLQDGHDVKYPVHLVPTYTLPELAPEGGAIIEMFYPVRADIPLDYWTAERRNSLVEAAIASLRRTYDLDVAVLRVRTPKEFSEEMRLYRGALYGLSPTVRPGEQFSHTSSLPGLYLAGQTTFPGYGVAPAMMSGILAAELVVREAAR
jgi:phytoene desaturase